MWKPSALALEYHSEVWLTRQSLPLGQAEVLSAGTLQESGILLGNHPSLSCFLTPSLISSGSRSLISHLPMNPKLRICFWGSLSKVVTILDKKDGGRSLPSGMSCGWVYFRSRQWTPKRVWWQGAPLRCGKSSLLCLFKIVLMSPFSVFYFCTYFIMKIILGQWSKLKWNNLNPVMELLHNVFLLIGNWDQRVWTQKLADWVALETPRCHFPAGTIWEIVIKAPSRSFPFKTSPTSPAFPTSFIFLPLHHFCCPKESSTGLALILRPNISIIAG